VARSAERLYRAFSANVEPGPRPGGVFMTLALSAMGDITKGVMSVTGAEMD